MRNLIVFAAWAVLQSSTCDGQESGDPLRPFSSEVISKYSGGGRAFELRRRYAQAADGSTLFSSENDPPVNDTGLRGEYSYSLNMRTRELIHSFSLIRAVIVRPFTDVGDLVAVQPRHTCAWLTDGTWRRVGEGKIRGIRVLEVVEDEREGATRMWVAPELNCFQMKLRRTKAGRIVQEDRLVSLNLNEPGPLVFDVPPRYEVLTPREFEKRFRTTYPGKQIYSDQLLERYEQQYQQSIEKAKRQPVRVPAK